MLLQAQIPLPLRSSRLGCLGAHLWAESGRQQALPLYSQNEPYIPDPNHMNLIQIILSSLTNPPAMKSSPLFSAQSSSGVFGIDGLADAYSGRFFIFTPMQLLVGGTDSYQRPAPSCSRKAASKRAELLRQAGAGADPQQASVK